jgi:TRAP-type C4-dicarboxylate transport system permease small subunit
VIGWLSDTSGYLSLVAVVCAMLAITYEVAARYLFRWPTVWEIEAAIYFLIFATFVGSAFALKEEKHISMDVITARLRPSWRARVELVGAVASLAFCVLASVKGWAMWWEAFSLGWHSDSLWAPPLAVPYFFLPLGFTLVSLQYLVNIAGRIREIRSREG